ncbi:zinc-binding alcohol dehydrogenase [Alicyclobacillus sp. SO9]|nr:zinc-binding alcohol dehydrogenase [Alicyclobacillus sp. SO9]
MTEQSVLIQTHFSAISPGTEYKLIESSRESPVPLGYSAAGTVLAVGSKVLGIKEGDKVACYGGPFVTHSERLVVPQNLCVRLPDDVSLSDAAFVGLGAIAVHGVRSLGIQFGEIVAIFGLGLLGQLSTQLCHEANYLSIVTDLSEVRRGRLLNHYSTASGVQVLDSSHFSAAISEASGGGGADAVLICAHSLQSGLLDAALEVVRYRGRVVIVGNIPVECSREKMFQKEVDVQVSRAGGIGRYDEGYENRGIDFPRSLVRWTEGRNMQEVIRLLASGRLDIDSLVTHRIAFNDAPSAYTEMKQESDFMAAVLSY